MTDTIQPNMFQELYDRVVTFVKQQGGASCYAIMKEFKLSYGQVVRLMDTMEEQEIVQPYLRDDDGSQKYESGPRKLMTPEFKKFYEKHERDRLQRIADRRVVQEAERKTQAEAATRQMLQTPEKSKKKKK